MSKPENQPEPGRVCPKCGKVIESDWNSCPFCGWVSGQLTKPVTTVTVPSQPQPVSHNYAITSIFFSILSIALIWTIVLPLILNSIGVFLGAIAIRKKDNWGYVGFILCLVFLIISVIIFIAFLQFMRSYL